MELKLDRAAAIGIETGCQESSVLQQFDAGQSGTKSNLEQPPIARLAQSEAQPRGGVSEEANAWHTGQPAAGAQDQRRV